jgi:ribosomal protein L11 methyltransferase
MAWQQLSCQTPSLYQDSLSDYLESAGAVSVTYQDAGDQPVLEPLPGETPLWDQLVITALFEADSDLSTLVTHLETSTDWKLESINLQILEEQDWERAWMDDFHPMQFGQRLWIYPSWAEVPDDDSVKLLLDPGLAFGTGTHPTTSLCLEWLDENPPIDKTVIDYGCGSGILAIAAIKLGANQVIATDIDEQALTATQDNMQRNQIPDEKISRYLPEAMPQQAMKQKKVDLLLANILSGPLVELSSEFADLVKPEGQLVLSGILQDQTEAILTAYSPFFEALFVKQLDGWIRVAGVRKQV